MAKRGHRAMATTWAPTKPSSIDARSATHHSVSVSRPIVAVVLAFKEVLVLGESLRQPIRFVDATGQQTELQPLLRRLEQKKPSRLALGGVLAARHYDPHFDLHGLPRIDVVMHAPIDLGWVRDLDPALRRATQSERSPVLVVHPLHRPEAHFVQTSRKGLPVADAVETLLALYELHLTQRAEDLVKIIRQ